MEAITTEEQLCRHIWLVGHSYPGRWISELQGPLDPRHPTRHSIWTSVLDSLQERVYKKGPHLRLDVTRCYAFNAAAKQKQGEKPDWCVDGESITGRISKLRDLLEKHSPPIVITFSAEVFVFVQRALTPKRDGHQVLGVQELGNGFRDAVQNYDPQKVNVFPLLHGYVARGDWATLGPVFSKIDDPYVNYFEYAGSALGDVLLSHCRQLPIWSL